MIFSAGSSEGAGSSGRERSAAAEGSGGPPGGLRSADLLQATSGWHRHALFLFGMNEFSNWDQGRKGWNVHQASRGELPDGGDYRRPIAAICRAPSVAAQPTSARFELAEPSSQVAPCRIGLPGRICAGRSRRSVACLRSLRSRHARFEPPIQVPKVGTGQLACPGGFEPPTYGLEGRCSVRAELRAGESHYRPGAIKDRAVGLAPPPTYGCAPASSRRVSPAFRASRGAGSMQKAVALPGLSYGPGPHYRTAAIWTAS